ncbi:unnamed protein product [Allacma fusca]|uniref:Peptidase M13 C-terminal domain-containing protein n=1 Tax=Allacma fusca TaxID=39272 RepID=A0A8J2JSA0_9HEXA|nr:unnamed protein product [Allacma fusca]
MWAKDHGVHETLLPQSNFTIEQIFYIATIATGQMECQTNQVISQMQSQDVHSPGPLRVKGVIQNSPNFGHIFGCPVGTPMNPTRIMSQVSSMGGFSNDVEENLTLDGPPNISGK